jgi:thiol:disulfide interchange protein DsbC
VLSERLPQLPPVATVQRTPMSGVFEVLLQDGTLIYSDAAGNFILQGTLIDTRRRVDLTEQRLQQLTAVRFDQLPLQDAFVIQRSKGTRQLAVFEDPHCGFCKRFEADLARIEDIKVYVFLYPVLGASSKTLARQIWCTRDRADAFLKWMLHDQPPPDVPCDDAALARNLEFGRKARINGTPTLIFADGTRVPGALPSARVEELLRAASGR